MKKMLLPAALLLAGIGLMAASLDSGLPDGYWDAPVAGGEASPHDWTGLEANLRPEACAQCHREQFDAWKDSRHAAAYSPGMAGQFAANGHAWANNCLQCHAPLAEQLYRSEQGMTASVKTLLQHRGEQRAGFSADADLDSAQAKLPLRHAGVTCATCHVRGWQRNGPPQRGTGAVGHVGTAAHGGFQATRDFERSGFCASCHQFPQSMAINGKPLENTVEEWKQSRFAEEGVHCQQCHMPDRQHLFKGIHDKQTTLGGLDISVAAQGEGATLTLTSSRIGHAFPTYVTPRITVLAEALSASGGVLANRYWQIGREVEYDDGWQESMDSRLMPGESREFFSGEPPEGTATMRFSLSVVPDHFYKGVYRSLLDNDPDTVSRAHLQKALADADANDYMLFTKELKLTPSR
ncbi:MAG: multiheme c-type cytochrome [Mariprofundaceae bacterium]|nr:multiheme c-type cytochrome [Mariprofundaceae bacterium]